jgi:hypothetical protein
MNEISALAGAAQLEKAMIEKQYFDVFPFTSSEYVNVKEKIEETRHRIEGK